MRIYKLIPLILLILLTSLACRAATGNIDPEPTSTPNTVRPTLRPLPSPTSVPVEDEPLQAPTATTVPAEEPAEPPEDQPGDNVETPDVSLYFPLGTPFTGDSFKSVPVLPGAQNASEDDSTLTFFTDLPTEEVLAYYQEVLPVDGWDYLGGDTSSPESLVVIYQKGDRMATIAILENFMEDFATMVVIAVP